MAASKMVTLGLVVLLLLECIHVLEATQSPAIRIDSHLKSVRVGDTVTLPCFNHDDMVYYLSWYRQTLGDTPQLVSTMYKYGQKPSLYNEFENNPRFSVQDDTGANNLTISDVRPSDSALYFCSKAYMAGKIDFADGVFLYVKGAGYNIKAVVQQPVSESIQLGDSVTLNCTIHTETCAGEHSVYWFTHGSGESHPGILYTHGGRSDQCEKSPEAGSPTQSCVYNLPKRNLSLSDAGTYYCAVASCGEILFGNGTKLDVQNPLLVYLLSGGLAVSVMLIIFLSWNIHKMKTSLKSTVNNPMPIVPPAKQSDSQDVEADELLYTAIDFEKRGKKERQKRSMDKDTIYSGLRQ